MGNLLGSLKDMFLDLFSMGKGFAYGFIMVGLFIVICGAVIYGVFLLKISYFSKKILTKDFFLNRTKLLYKT